MMRFQTWFLVNLASLLLLFLLGIGLFVVVAENLDNEFSAVAREQHMGLVLMTHIRLLPAYLIVAVLHSILSWPLARRRCHRRVSAGGTVTIKRLLAWGLYSTFGLFILSLGPMTYAGPGSLDALARQAVRVSPALNLYVFKTWHLQEIFTLVVVVLFAMACLDCIRFIQGRFGNWSRNQRRVFWLSCGLLMGVPAGFWWSNQEEPARQGVDRPNILIIGSDSLRYDHLSCHGYSRDVSPNIDSIVRDGIDFTNLHVGTASTLESWGTFLTGRFPANHGLRYMFITKDQAEGFDSQVTLCDVLREDGYQSSVVGDWAANCFKLVDYGFDRTLTSDVQNLDVFLAEVAYRTHILIPHYFSHAFGEWLMPTMRQVTGFMNAEHLTDRFIDELDDASVAGNPFFGVLFLSSTHLPFLASHPYNSMYTSPDYRGPNRFSISFDVDDFIQHGFAEAHSEAERQHVLDLYDGGVRQFDDQVGKVLRHLEETGLDKNTIVIVTSDHGEDLYDPDTTLGHGTNFFGGDQSTRIPLMMRLPGCAEAGRKVTQVTRNTDLMPSLLDLTGSTANRPRMDGVSLVGPMGAEGHSLNLAAFSETCYLFFPKKVPGEEVYSMDPADRTLRIDSDFRNQFVLKDKYHDYVIETKDRMIRTNRYKLIYIKGRNGPIYRLYDMINDPTQRNDLSNSNLPVMNELKRCLIHWIETGEALPWPAHLDEGP